MPLKIHSRSQVIEYLGCWSAHPELAGWIVAGWLMRALVVVSCPQKGYLVTDGQCPRPAQMLLGSGKWTGFHRQFAQSTTHFD